MFRHFTCNIKTWIAVVTGKVAKIFNRINTYTLAMTFSGHDDSTINIVLGLLLLVIIIINVKKLVSLKRGVRAINQT